MVLIATSGQSRFVVDQYRSHVECLQVIGYDVNLPLSPFFILSLVTNIIVTGFAGSFVLCCDSNFTELIIPAGRIWWIGRQARLILGKGIRKRYNTSVAIL